MNTSRVAITVCLLFSCALAILAMESLPASGVAVSALFQGDGIPQPTNTIRVSSLVELGQAIAVAKPGDQIVLADESYSSAVPIEVNKQGTAEHPIVISAQTVGGAEIAGVGSFVIGKDAAHVVIDGFKFT